MATTVPTRRAGRTSIAERAVGARGTLAPLAVLVALIVLVTISEPAFLTPNSLTSMAVDAGPVLLLVFGSTLVILLGGIDLSVAALTSLCSVLLALWLPGLGSWAVPAVIVAAATLGAMQGLIQAVTQIPSFVVTLGGLGIFSGLALRLSNASSQPLLESYALVDFAAGDLLGIPNTLLIVAVAVGLLAAVMRFLPIGRRIYAVGAGERAALLSGVGTVRVRVFAFATSGACAGLAALLLVAQTQFAGPDIADNLLLPAIAAVVVGGTAISGGVGGLGAALIGGLIVTVVRVGTVIVGLDPAVQNVVFGVGVIVAVALTTDRAKIGIIK